MMKLAGLSFRNARSRARRSWNWVKALGTSAAALVLVLGQAGDPAIEPANQGEAAGFALEVGLQLLDGGAAPVFLAGAINDVPGVAGGELPRLIGCGGQALDEARHADRRKIGLELIVARPSLG
jgi:hypothetical protein